MMGSSKRNPDAHILLVKKPGCAHSPSFDKGYNVQSITQSAKAD